MRARSPVEYLLSRSDRLHHQPPPQITALASRKRTFGCKTGGEGQKEARRRRKKDSAAGRGDRGRSQGGSCTAGKL
ncbi:hypothetical protein L596_023414 [Steinernema carpocapsae]|uniref:Uncharacterized protein n=1 Tax=Steinernema carpocapsae TaxID=34508 RepID=A0A4U5MDK4_STECR|nr:hypothetical protein L596_023414 [Steinernema carpocapsae]